MITAVGPDRPGMAYAVTDVLSRLGCNIEDTTMTRLSGEFAMILAVTPPAQLSCEELAAQLAALQKSHGLFCNCRAIDDDAILPEEDEPRERRYVVSAYAPEKQGLLAHMTRILADYKVNITDVQTRVASGGAVYVMLFEIILPVVLTERELEVALVAAGREIGAEVSLRHLEEDTL